MKLFDKGPARIFLALGAIVLLYVIGSFGQGLNQSGGAGGTTNVSQWGGANVATGGVAGSMGVGGLAASGAAKSGNPNQIGGVFNTTQPTVTNGQAVEAQMTARGAQIVSSGVDPFNVTVNAALPAGGNAIGSITNTAFGLNAGANLIGFAMTMPAGCSGSGAALVVHNTVGVATGAGTSVSAVTGCIVEGYITNITNSPVQFRLADKTGTPIIWIGGNADFTVPANSNMGFGSNGGANISGIIFTSGITAIAGTAAALNLHILARE